MRVPGGWVRVAREVVSRWNEGKEEHHHLLRPGAFSFQIFYK